MAPSPGTRFADYEIIAPIGAGGMGEVYRARDITLERDVAIKLLPAAVATDPERLSRFEREARTLAALNHAHIAQIYGLVTADGVRAIVMELVEGEDLAARLQRGPIALDETLAIARQIAEALETAHGAGVIHRDLKPANIKVRPDGTVKVLDFGLAKLAASDSASSGVDLKDSPTMTSPAHLRQGYGEAGTQVGVILGTAAYMAPEQAKGRIVDKRADVWAFGCVLYEMLTGRPLFAGDDVAETLAAVLKSEPQWTSLPASTPESVRRLLRRCLVKDPRQRLPDIGAARLEVDEAMVAPPAPPAPSNARSWIGAAVAGVLGLAIGAAVATLWKRELPVAPERVLQVTSGEELATPVLSPHGQAVAYVRDSRLVIRSLVTAEDIEIGGSEPAANPFWSPDSKHLAFFREGELGWELRVVAANGTGNRVLVNTTTTGTARRQPAALYGGSWCHEGMVLHDNVSQTMQLIGDSQGQVIATFETPPDSGTLAYPSCLGDGRILAVRRTNLRAAIVVASRTEQTVLVELPITNPVDVRYPLLAADGVVIFERSQPAQGLWALPVASDLRSTTGPPRPILADATRASIAAGMLAVITGEIRTDRQLVWVDRRGKQLSIFGKPQREFRTPSLSPDLSRVVTGGRRGTTRGLWMHSQDTAIPWVEEAGGRSPAWSPDGQWIATSVQTNNADRKRAIVVRTPAGTEARALSAADGTGPSWTWDSQSLVYSNGDTDTVWHIGATADATPRQVLTKAREAAVSPNNKLIAYTSDVTGRFEAYVTTFPEAGQPVTISIDGGRHPRWTRSGNELFYACGGTTGDDPNGARALCVASIDPTSGARRGPPTRLFDAAKLGYRVVTFGERGYDIAQDGSRVLLQTGGNSGTPIITLIENVDAWLRRRAQ